MNKEESNKENIADLYRNFEDPSDVASAQSRLRTSRTVTGGIEALSRILDG